MSQNTSEQRTPEERAAVRQNQKSPIETVLADIPDEARTHARIVGAWVWVHFDDKPDPEVRETLIDIGFRWNPKRQSWQHSCGVKSRRSPDDPRMKYGEIPVSGQTE